MHAISAYINLDMVMQDSLCPVGGRRLRRLLFEAGGHTHTPQQQVLALLGDPCALVALDEDDQNNGGWVPDLASDVWQDIDLLR
jgi:hypothetical protein